MDKEITVVFPQERKFVRLEVPFRMLVSDLVESLKKHFALPENMTIDLYTNRERTDSALIDEQKTLEDQAVPSGATLYAFVKRVTRLKIIFPKSNDETLNLECVFEVRVFDVISLLEDYLKLQKKMTVRLYKSQDESDGSLLIDHKTFAEQGVVSEAILFAFVEEHGPRIRFFGLNMTVALKINDKTATLEDIKEEVIVALGLDLSKQYAFTRTSKEAGSNELRGDQTFDDFDDFECIQVKELCV